MHKPVLLEEVIKFLDLRPGEFMIDGTLDGGGHARAIIEKVAPRGKFLGVDLDKSMVERFRNDISGVEVSLKDGNYAELPEILKEKKLGKADGLFLDLGFSSEQLESGRGFSFQKDEPLIMTYDDKEVSVREVLKKMSEQELADIISELGGERFARRIANAIVSREKKKYIETSGELADVIRKAVPKNYERGRINPATRTFQALRIYANNELGNIAKVLDELPEILKPNGRVVIITFHSLEDKIVKNKFREMEKQKLLSILTKKPILPTTEEILENPRSRSAKLRAAKII